MSAQFRFVIPDPRASISGGNLYNLGLIGALEDMGVDVDVLDRDRARSERLRGRALTIVDSLYLDVLPAIARANSSERCLLLAHYLPALVEGRVELSAPERAALVAATGFMAPSALMARELSRLAPEPRPVVVIAPGVEVDLVRACEVPPLARSGSGRAVIVANLVPGKGVLDFLRALGPRPLPLAVIGSPEVDSAYAAACRATRPEVAFLGARSHPQTLTEIASSDFLISSSRMESFGLALAEARALGVPIVARAGGNVAAHVDPAAGGRLFDTDEALADECVRLVADRRALSQRQRAAMAMRPQPRTWADAARELVSAFAASSDIR